MSLNLPLAMRDAAQTPLGPPIRKPAPISAAEMRALDMAWFENSGFDMGGPELDGDEVAYKRVRAGEQTMEVFPWKIWQLK